MCLNFYESLVLKIEIGVCFCRLGYILSIWVSETDFCWVMDIVRVFFIFVSCFIDFFMFFS